MKIGELGEFNMIRRILPRFPAPSGAIKGIGDDCAVLPGAPGRVQLVTTDLLVERVHFLLDRITPEELGHKALAVNASDIAAMGGQPTAAFLSIGLPPTIEVEWIDRLFAGIEALSRQIRCPLLGGDTTRSMTDMVINFAVLGDAAENEIKLRSTARPGDVVAVTGFLGDSGAGLRLLLERHRTDRPDCDYLVRAHHAPMPHLAEGGWLARRMGVHAMMDVSDGIDSDIHRIMEQSGVGAGIELEQLPLSAPMRNVCHAHGWDALELAATGGEDYCLLCTVEGAAYEAVSLDFVRTFGKPLHAIGTIRSEPGLRYTRGGRPARLAGHGFDHFASPG